VAVAAALSYSATQTSPPRGSSLPPAQALYGPERLPGLGERLHLVEGSVDLAVSAVDRRGSPTRGYQARLALGGAASVDEDAYTHVRLDAQATRFVELFYERTLEVWTAAAWRWAPGADRIPFYRLASLGGSQGLPGYSRGRFRGHGALVAGLRYRFPIWEVLDGFLFHEQGRVVSSPDDLSLHRWRRSSGVGLRLWRAGRFVLEQAAAWSPEEFRLVFAVETGT
jgi:outer membrane translocation and assembly module TamA